MSLGNARFKSAEYERTLWVATPEPGVSVKDLLAPEYWAHVGAKLRPWDRIEVRAEDGAYFAELLVLDASRLWAKVQVIHHVELPRVEDTAPDDPFEVKWRGPQAKFGVIRRADKSVLKDGFADRNAAADWLTGHKRAMAA